MKISSVNVMKIPPCWVWVKVDTDEGIIGYGEPYLENHADQVISELQRLEPLIIGEDPTRTEYLWDKLYHSGIGYVGGPLKMSAISGLDMAFWDIKGKALGQPVWKLLGGEFRDRVKVYRSVGSKPVHFVEPGDPYWHPKYGEMAAPSDEPAGYRDAAIELVNDWGFRCLKLHISIGDSFEQQKLIPQIYRCVEAVFKAVGDMADVAIDIHNPHPKMGLKLVRALEEFPLLFVEEPVPPERIEALRIVTSGTVLPVAAGERWMGKWAFREALDAGASILQPDIAHAGGITELKKIAAIAEVYHAKMAPHCPLSPLSFAASLQLAAVTPNFLVQEHNEVNDFRTGGRTAIGYGYMQEPFLLDDDGYVQAPQTPGLGFEPDEAGLLSIMRKDWHYQRG